MVIKKLVQSLCFSSLVIILSIAHFGGFIAVKAAGILFVAPGGSDEYSCTDPLFPCATIQAAIGKAAPGDTVKVAIGIYTGSGDQVVRITKNISLSGGWDASFISQNGASIIDGQSARYEVWVNNLVIATIEHFIIQNGRSGILNYGDLTANYIIVQNNLDTSCWGGGIFNGGTLLLQWSTVSGNKCGGSGGGIYNWISGGPLIIMNSTISNNQASVAGGIYNQNILTVINSTISNNKVNKGMSNSEGGGIYTDSHAVVLKNVTISGNDGALSGGGIFFSSTWGGSVTLSNTILYNNIADANPDCSGPISSAGYNIISDTTGCSFGSTTGDQLNVDFRLGDLQNNGGPTFTQWLYQDSSAIDGGNPAGCTDQNGDLLTIDQRGFTRPLDGNNDGINICDIGAFEADPNNLPPPPLESFWYVTPIGNNSQDCHSPATSCATIRGAIAKAITGDTVYVSTGVYTTTLGNEVVLIDKNINLLGGWDTGFTAQTGRSTIDGQHFQRGITIKKQIKARIEDFIIQNGLAPYTSTIENANIGGGGIYIDYRSKVTLTDSIIQANIAGSDDPFHPSSPNGGGIAMHNSGSLTINSSIVTGNTAHDYGGGISSGGSALIVNDSTIGANTAYEGGGISGGGSIEVNHSRVINNTSIGPYDGGGGISSNNTLFLNDSSVTGNIAAFEGGGILGNTMTISNSLISNNKAQLGGGISAWFGELVFRNSALLNNTATSAEGGGIYLRADLLLVNSTIAYNKAITTGGGIFRAFGYIQASNATIARNVAENSGGGISNQTAPLSLRNSLLAENEAAVGPDCTGTINSAGYNLIGQTTGCDFSPSAGDLTGIDPRIASLYGSPNTLTLFSDSPAIDAGNPGGCTDHQGNQLAFDQIHTVRPLDGNDDDSSICDIGSFEYDPNHLPQYLFLPLIKR